MPSPVITGESTKPNSLAGVGGRPAETFFSDAKRFFPVAGTYVFAARNPSAINKLFDDVLRKLSRIRNTAGKNAINVFQQLSDVDEECYA